MVLTVFGSTFLVSTNTKWLSFCVISQETQPTLQENYNMYNKNIYYKSIKAIWRSSSFSLTVFGSTLSLYKHYGYHFVS